MVIYPTVRRFFNTEAGGASPSDPQVGASSPADPFASLNLDDLDPATRAVVEASKVSFATLQKDAAEAKKAAEQSTQQARQFQSAHDKVVAELQRMKGPQQVSPEDARLAAVEKVLIEKGITAEQAKVQAPIFADMFGIFAEQIKGDIGRDLAPLGASVMQGEANRAWQQAETMDKLAALQIPEVRQKTWEGVQQLIQSNQAVTAATVLNLRNIYYAEHQENGQQQQQMPPNSNYNTPPMPSFGIPNFGGGGNSAQRPLQHDPKAPRHTLNADTAAALKAVTDRWPKKQGGK